MNNSTYEFSESCHMYESSYEYFVIHMHNLTYEQLELYKDSYTWHDCEKCPAVHLQCFAVCCTVLHSSYSNVWFVHVTWLVASELFICVIHICDTTFKNALLCTCSVLHYVAVCCTRVMHMCDSYMWHDSEECPAPNLQCVALCCTVLHSSYSLVWFTYVTWLMCMCDMTHSCMWHDSFTCVTWLFHICDTTHVW